MQRFFIGAQFRKSSLSISTKNPSGMRGGVSSSYWLHHGHGAPAAPQEQAFGPLHGLPGGSHKPSRCLGRGCISCWRCVALGLGVAITIALALEKLAVKEENDLIHQMYEVAQARHNWLPIQNAGFGKRYFH
jgi:hypothetical protein